MLEVLNDPILALILDKGRFKYTHLGIKVSGVMDEYAYYFVNYLLDNPDNTNTIEINFPNVSFLAHKDTTIALCGANCEFYINEVAKSLWQTYHIKKGDIIKIGKILNGLRVYLSVKNGFIVKKEIWGLNNIKLKKADVLQYNTFISQDTRRIKQRFIPQYPQELELRVILSYQAKYFSKEQKNKFFSNTYIVSNEISRMGYKLKGEPIFCDISDIISEGIAFGSIQIPKDGQPIVLLKDRQTIGGYPKIGVVLDIDCFKLVQAKPNTKIRFKKFLELTN
jgi:biotin-dependent carboxylase-like uncharacterized protein